MLHMAYGTLEPEINRTKRRRLKFTSHGDTEELLRHCRPAVRKRVMDARIIRQRSAARS